MSDIATIYARETRKAFRAFAVWTPNTRVKLGDVGVLKGGVFIRISSLSELIRDYKINERVENVAGSIYYTSSNAVSVSTKTKGSIPPTGWPGVGKLDVAFMIEFGRKHAVLFKAVNVCKYSIENQVDLGQQVSYSFIENLWQKKYLVVTELQKASMATIIISSNSKSRIALKAESGLSTEGLEFGSYNGLLQIAFASGIGFKMIAESELTPLVGLSGMLSQRGYPDDFGSKYLANSSKDDEEPVDDSDKLQFRELDIEELSR